MNTKTNVLSSDTIALDAKENVIRHQLNIVDYWAHKKSQSEENKSLGNSVDKKKREEKPVSNWNLSQGFELREWQLECQDKWFSEGKKGVVKVVTGAGKTIFALSLIQRLQNEVVPDLRVIAVVPTIVLQSQWYDLIKAHSNIPPDFIGRLGGGYRDHLEGNCRILICVLNSAANYLPKMKDAFAENLLLIVDECHRSGSKQMSNIFSFQRAFNLGLSATPERNDTTDIENSEEEESSDIESFDEPMDFEDSIVGRELGPIIFELNYLDALESSILAKFELRHYGLPLEEKERIHYEKTSREITELRRQLQSLPSAKGMDGGKLVGWARREASKGGSDFSSRAANYVSLISERKRLLYSAHARLQAVQKLIRQSFESNPEARILLFHESIDSVMLLFNQLRLLGFPTVVEHSQLTDSLRAESLHLFREGKAKILVSARSLIEGFDVPAADVGIVVASSSSVRQRIQTLGRILRKKEDEDRVAVLHILYVAETTDEFIYEKYDWGKATGTERNQFFLWDPDSGDEPSRQEGAPRTPKPRETEIDWTRLSPGSAYPGEYQGQEYSADTQQNITDAEGRLILNPQRIPEVMKEHRGGYGRFRVTPQKKAVICHDSSLGRIVFLGCLNEPFQTSKSEMTTETDSMKVFDLSLKNKSGHRRICWKVKEGELFARTAGKSKSQKRGKDCEKILQEVEKLEVENNLSIYKISLRSDLKVYAKIHGEEILVADLEEGLEFAKQLLP
ncbi:MAG: DEAD/DEAH box helicase [Opitutales bacterium]|nr:DEAD/DEAH box helicase [Opitutales bacterium]